MMTQLYIPSPCRVNDLDTSSHCANTIRELPNGYLFCCRAKARIDAKYSVMSRRAKIWDRDMFIAYLHDVVGMSLRHIHRLFGDDWQLKAHSTISRAFRRIAKEFTYLWNKAKSEVVREQPLPSTTIGKVVKNWYNSAWKSTVNKDLNVHLATPEPHRCVGCEREWYAGSRLCPYCGWAIPNMLCNFWRECRWGGDFGKRNWNFAMEGS